VHVVCVGGVGRIRNGQKTWRKEGGSMQGAELSYDEQLKFNLIRKLWKNASDLSHLRRERTMILIH
jgi:hypothetical protein